MLYDVLIVGSGPAGLAAAARAQERKLRYLVLERREHLADTLVRYQKGKRVMAEPGLIPQRGELPFEPGSREQVLDAWNGFVADRRLEIQLGQEVTRVERTSQGFRVSTKASGDRPFEAKHLILALGTQGNPRRLGVPGEDSPLVTSHLDDPDAYSDQDIVVIGAGDSALEVALALCERNRVHLVVRTAEIVRAKESLEREIVGREAADELTIHYRTTVRAVGEDTIDLHGPEEDLRLPVDRVITQIGADPPRKLLEGWGVEFTGDGAGARPTVSSTFESSVPGLYLIGAVSGRDLIKLAINQGFEVIEHLTGNAVEPADEAILRERLPFGTGTVQQRLATLRDAIPVFQEADEELLREVFLLAEIRDFDDGETILRQNDYTDSFLVIAEGAVAIKQRGLDGIERPGVELTAGNFFGEMGLLSGRRRNATAIARGVTRLVEVPRKAMVKLLHLAPGVRKVVDWAFLLRALRSYVFPELEESTLYEIAREARVERFGRQQVVFAENEQGRSLYLVRSGMVKLSKRSGEREIVLTYLVAGNVFGESALLADSPRTATVTAIFPTELIVLDRKRCEQVFDRHPEVRQRLLADLESKRLASLASEASPGVGEILGQLIETEAVIGTDVLLIDNHRCVRCNNCVEACEAVHDDGQSRLSLTGSQVANLLLPNSCMQCENPLCMLDCPPDAIVRRPGGEIHIRESCIGCGNCATHCPYDNIFMVHPEPKSTGFGWLDRLLGWNREPSGQEVAVKCDLCRGIDGGPACVRSCPTGAAIRLEPSGPEDLRERVEDLVDTGGLL